jgi:hypothetical protein
VTAVVAVDGCTMEETMRGRRASRGLVFCALGAGALVTACGSARPAETTAAQTAPGAQSAAPGELWIVGTPAVMQCEGYCLVYRTSSSPTGPWEERELEGADALTPGELHRARVTRIEQPGIADAPSSIDRIDEILESRTEAVPPIVLVPGRGAAGLMLAQLGEMGLSEVPTEFGPYMVSRTSVVLPLARVGPVQIGEHVVDASMTIEQIATAFTGCHTVSARGPAARMDCDGVKLLLPPSSEASVEIVLETAP